MILRRALLAAALLLPACTSLTSEDEREYRVELAQLTYSGVDAQVEVPATVQAGVPFLARAVSWGSTCRRPAHSSVTTVGRRTDVLVYVREPIDGACNRALGAIEHTIPLVIHERGTATVAFYSRAEGDLLVAGPVIQRTVTVQ